MAFSALAKRSQSIVCIGCAMVVNNISSHIINFNLFRVRGSFMHDLYPITFPSSSSLSSAQTWVAILPSQTMKILTCTTDKQVK